MMISYAQNREDVLLQRAFPPGYKGFYLDVGANEPVQCSVTKHFSLQGWRGINIEPQPALYEKLCADRPDDVNLNIGASDREATLEFLECPANPGLSTFLPSLAEQWHRDMGLEFVSRHLPVKTLTEVCEAHVRGTIDFLKIDAEGFEREVILGLDWTRWRPRIVLVEAACPELWEPLLHAANYLSATFDGINLYYVRAEEPELLGFFKAPLSVLDDSIPHWVQHSLDEREARASFWKQRSELLEQQAGELRAVLAASERRAAELESRAASSEHALATANAELAGYRAYGPNALRVARKAQRLAARHPRLSRAFKRAAGLGRVAG